MRQLWELCENILVTAAAGMLQEDLSMEQLLTDSIAVLRHMCQGGRVRRLLLAGHSLGGAVATHLAHRVPSPLLPPPLTVGAHAVVM